MLAAVPAPAGAQRASSAALDRGGLTAIAMRAHSFQQCAGIRVWADASSTACLLDSKECGRPCFPFWTYLFHESTAFVFITLWPGLPQAAPPACPRAVGSASMRTLCRAAGRTGVRKCGEGQGCVQTGLRACVQRKKLPQAQRARGGAQGGGWSGQRAPGLRRSSGCAVRGR